MCLPRHPKEMEQFMAAEERERITSGDVFFEEVRHRCIDGVVDAGGDERRAVHPFLPRLHSVSLRSLPVTVTCRVRQVGGEYKRTVALIRMKRDMPQCQKCYTFADYKPPVKVTTTGDRPPASCLHLPPTGGRCHLSPPHHHLLFLLMVGVRAELAPVQALPRALRGVRGLPAHRASAGPGLAAPHPLGTLP